MLEFIRNLLWGPCTIAFIVVLAVMLVFKTNFRALRHPIRKLRETLFSSCKNHSSMEAMFTALGGTIGVGNTIGVAGAIKEGGVGALFWMFIASFFGMIIKEAEIFLAVKFKDRSCAFSGPMFYIRDALGSKLLSKIWSISCIFTAFGMGNFSQSMSCTNCISETLKANKIITSVFVASILFISLMFGLVGIKKIVSSFVPILSLIFIGSTLIILLMNVDNLTSSIAQVFSEAFNFTNGIIGIKWSLFVISLREGFSRGIFTNEAGLGSSSIVHSSSNETTPEKQASWGVIEVFIDTTLICMLTGLMIVSSDIDLASTDFENITLNIFSSSLGKIGTGIYTVSTLFFAIASMLAWFYYAECAMQYLNFSNTTRKIVKYFFVIAAFFGGIISAKSILLISDIFNAVMLLINIITIFLISNQTKSN